MSSPRIYRTLGCSQLSQGFATTSGLGGLEQWAKVLGAQEAEWSESRYNTVDHVLGSARQSGGRKRSIDRNKGPSPSRCRLEEFHIGVVRKVTCLYSITMRMVSTHYYARHTRKTCRLEVMYVRSSEHQRINRVSDSQIRGAYSGQTILFGCFGTCIRTKRSEMARQLLHCWWLRCVC